MPFSDHAPQLPKAPMKSRLSESLLRLQQNLEQTRESESQTEGQFQAWQDRWAERREQIARRLELIDMQFESLVSRRVSRPNLSLIGAGEGTPAGHAPATAEVPPPAPPIPARTTTPLPTTIEADAMLRG